VPKRLKSVPLKTALGRIPNRPNSRPHCLSSIRASPTGEAVRKTNIALGGYAPLIPWRGARPAQQNGPPFAFRLCPPLMIHYQGKQRPNTGSYSLIIPCYDLQGCGRTAAEFATTTASRSLREEKFPVFFPVTTQRRVRSRLRPPPTSLQFWNSLELPGEIP
jgi:hypothetical protein